MNEEITKFYEYLKNLKRNNNEYMKEAIDNNANLTTYSVKINLINKITSYYEYLFNLKQNNTEENKLDESIEDKEIPW